jgi:hypothetical protein
MPSILQVGDLRDAMPPLKNWDMPLRMYYDETNNIRRLTLSEVGLNVPDNRTFVIAGIALKPGRTISGWQALRNALRMQASAGEVKFKHVAPSDYEGALGAPKLSLLLTWLLDNDVAIHYSALDVLHWSLIDIVESLMPGDPLGINAFHIELKAELHHVVRRNPSEFMSLLHGFSYPNVDRSSVQPFLDAVSQFLVRYAPTDRNFATTVLKQTLRHASRLQGLELPFLYDNEPGELIGDFSNHFLHCMYVFKNATHTFDRETYVEKVLQQSEVRDGERRLDYRFVDSKEDVGIQLSDVITGLLGKHFSYLQDHSLPQLRKRKAAFSGQQAKSLQLLRTLIDRSDELSDGLCHAVLPLDTVFKNNAFLHDQDVPDFMG